MAIGERLKKYFSKLSLYHKIDGLEQRVINLLKEKRQSERELKALRAELDHHVTKVQQSIANANRVNDRLEEALLSAQESLKTANDIVIPGLVAANKTFRDAWDAQSTRSVIETTLLASSKEE